MFHIPAHKNIVNPAGQLQSQRPASTAAAHGRIKVRPVDLGSRTEQELLYAARTAHRFADLYNDFQEEDASEHADYLAWGDMPIGVPYGADPLDPNAYRFADR